MAGAPSRDQATSGTIIELGPRLDAVPRVHHRNRAIGEVPPLVLLMSGRDQDEVVFRRDWDGDSSREVGMFAGGSDDGNVWIVVMHQRSARLEFLHQHIAGRLAVVIHVGLVREAEE